jgi:3-oxoacyl-[acyl-carrier-protein] synthase II
MRRVVVTGYGGLTALGHDWPSIRAAMSAGRTGIRHMPDWEQFEELNTKLGAPVMEYQLPEHYNRKKTRSMGPVAVMATRASELALEMAGLIGDPVLRSGRCGVAYGSSAGSIDATASFARYLQTGNINGVTSNSYVQMMSHTTTVNVALFFRMTGRIIPTSSACTSGSQGVGFAYEAIKHGYQDVMIGGGAEELSSADAAVFDTLFATSTKNDAPETTPSPYDRDRDGLVVGEGAVSLVLESLEHAQARGATILAEVVGFGTNSDGTHITQPNADTMAVAMRQALADADLDPAAVAYVSGHGTATDRGDVAETQATREVFGRAVPISSMKGYFGHTLGACGSLESWLAIEMMRDGSFMPTPNLHAVDERCGDLDYLMGEQRSIDAEYIMNNNFAFGGINTSLIFRRWAD